MPDRATCPASLWSKPQATLVQTWRREPSELRMISCASQYRRMSSWIPPWKSFNCSSVIHHIAGVSAAASDSSAARCASAAACRAFALMSSCNSKTCFSVTLNFCCNSWDDISASSVSVFANGWTWSPASSLPVRRCCSRLSRASRASISWARVCSSTSCCSTCAVVERSSSKAAEALLKRCSRKATRSVSLLSRDQTPSATSL
mmetsp:Transcript_173982/g.557782  ORF Transcript_173982/g.557782 Transcript_173982/m.557782 type:complete len:204 (-) Transcript_173982:351-962(-)